MTKAIQIEDIKLGGDAPLVLIAGPCVIESEQAAMDAAERLKRITADLGIPFIFKSSYDKANRSSVKSYRGPGLKQGLRILSKIAQDLDLPILSDIHRFEEIAPAAEVLDVIQIPAFLSRQTDLLLETARTGRVVNIKKGQFLAPWDMKNAVEKAASTGNDRICVTERGVSFGYNNLVVDMRSLPVMRGFGVPVIFDATHSVQLPGGAGHASSGDRRFVPHLTRAAVAAGIDGLFMEVHPCPDEALCDGPNMMSLDELPSLLKQVMEIDGIVKR
ncbi:MAG: 3-deoxy-8-phosphooctulonate synthase [Nitrospirae bacterium GWC2_57_13]|nr:MAG: 3-deoxy-8-phosphooctulonate synthase [Nitrospirae bacterium GWC1_57_7]OGW27862.1 MAG: 3-deoxy-8-phosphooctulonate synthase [Nitrospirae bacterium GWC2_57_13]OGW45749.1 MAG: 3-deoxy-8-phosphooctulonate synthase [Nitrospirae bacterium GWD2_57_8]HAS53277.1 3-deoxy-8-phosphooctulonate synthase [Nitrospiraceae bacterium]